MNLVEKILRGDQNATAKLISKIDNEPNSISQEIKFFEQKKIPPSHILGITGSPGVGKSTLVAQLIDHYRKMKKKVGVLAIDPSSPFTGGALLGDRIRMQMHTPDNGVFIRSMATRGNSGGISKGTKNAVKVLNAWGADTVIVETVGVGQGEYEIMKVADTILVVLAPGMGDDIQTMKAGILEIGDIFVINKIDLYDPGNLEYNLGLVSSGRKIKGWTTAIIKTVAIDDIGIGELYKKIEEHRRKIKNEK